MSNPSPVEQVQTQLMLAQSDAKVERDEAVSWLLAHPNEAAPVVERAVRDGTAPDPRLYLSLLGHYARAEDVAAIEAALRRGVPGESFYAAAALASNGTDAARQAMLRGLEHENPMIRGAIADALVDPESRWACDGLSLRFEDPDPDVRFRVLRAAFRAGCIDAATVRARASTLGDEARTALEALLRGE